MPTNEFVFIVFRKNFMFKRMFNYINKATQYYCLIHFFYLLYVSPYFGLWFVSRLRQIYKFLGLRKSLFKQSIALDYVPGFYHSNETETAQSPSK